MKVVRTIAELRAELHGEIGFVPTMGAFHEGHLSLMRKAREVSDLTVVSIFVNPLQFGDNEDLSKYPRDEERDFQMAKEVGVSIVFAPLTEELIGDNYTNVQVSRITELWEGEFRPGHFDGVATIVCKLFNIIGECHAVFGLKDYQQCAVVTQMVKDLNLPVKLIFEETTRENDGLALSSRNRYLSSSNRDVAPVLFRTLESARNQMLVDNSIVPFEQVLINSKQVLIDAGFNVDYFAYVDVDTLQPKAIHDGNGRILAAVRLGESRLIDNIEVKQSA